MSTSGGPDISQDGLVLYLDATNEKSYPGSGTSFNDLSRRVNSISLINTPTFTNKRFQFSSTNDYISVPASDSTNIRGSITAAMYCKSNTANWNMYWSGISKYSQFILGPNAANNSSGKMAFLVHSGTWYPSGYAGDIWGQSDIDKTEYHYYVGTYNQSSGILAMYVDGVEEASFNIGTRTLTNDPNAFAIGKRDVSGNYLNFTLGIAQIYNRALSQSEIIQNYNALKSRFI